MPNFIDKRQQEMHFPHLRNALDGHLNMLRSKGVDVLHKRAEVITVEMENKFWTIGVVGFHSPKALLNAISYHNGKKIHATRLSRASGTEIFPDCSRIPAQQVHLLRAWIKKSPQGGISDTSDGKVVTIVHFPNQSRCHVALLDLYLSKVPPECITNDSKFYLQSLPFAPTVSHPWFFSDPVGVQMIKSMVKDMCRDGGFQGNFTNHSLMATGATTLFDAGVPEVIIQK